jgi:3-hydroxybutyryl-CoA dehydrogenase
MKSKVQPTSSSMSTPHTVGICGIGQIGLALALSCYRFGHRVFLFGRDPEKLERARREFQRLDEWLNLNFPEKVPQYGKIEFVSELGQLDRDADLVIEGIAENLPAKVELFRSLACAAARGAIFCTTTSGLSITEMGRMTDYAIHLVGTHFWNPPHLMPLVEVIAGARTSDTAMDTVIKFCRSIGKKPVRVNADVPGFIGNRMLHALWREAIDLVERGIASPEDVDTVAKLTFGLRMPVIGPLENMDVVGLDLIRTIHEYLLPGIANNAEPSRLLNEYVSSGRLGIKSGRGFYDWKERSSAELTEARDQQIIRELKRVARDQKSLRDA